MQLPLKVKVFREIPKQAPLKSASHLPKKIVVCLIESPLKMMKNVFYFILKVLFVLQTYKFLSWVFGLLEKAALLER